MVTVVAALLVMDDRLFIARRGPGETLAGKWEFPGGKVKGQEKPECALARELAEEFGIRVEIGDFFGENVHHYAHASVKLWAYWAHQLNGDLRLSVHDRYSWVRIPELKGYEFSPADVPIVRALEQQLLEDCGVLRETPADVIPRRF